MNRDIADGILKLWNTVSIADRLLVAERLVVMKLEQGSVNTGENSIVQSLVNVLSHDDGDVDTALAINFILQLANRSVLEYEARPKIDFSFEDIEYGVSKAIEHRLARQPAARPTPRNGADDDDRD